MTAPTVTTLPLAAGQWTVDRNHSGVLFTVRHLGLTNVRGRFGAFDATLDVGDTLDQVSRRPKVLTVRMRNVPAIDSTAMHALKDLIRRTRQQGTLVFLSDVHSQPLVALQRTDLLAEIGEDNLFGDVDAALDAARARLGAA